MFGRRHQGDEDDDLEQAARLEVHVHLHVTGELGVRLLPPAPVPAGIVALPGIPTPKETP